MPKIMHVEVAISLPADEFEEAAAKLKIKPAFDTFVTALRDAGVKFDQELKTLETRAKPATGTGARRGRKPRAQSADGAQQPANPAALVS